MKKPAYTVDPTTGCWLWQRARNEWGYGNTLFRGRTWKAHRVAWVIANGEIPEGMNVLHRCDRPACVNPAHLFLGTAADNTADMLKKSRHGTAKLSAAQVDEIRRSAAIRHGDLAARYGVDRSTISKVLRKASHKHRESPARGPAT